MHSLRFHFLVLPLVALACSEPKSGPSSSSSSHFLECAADADCGNLLVPATCGDDGYCAASGKKIEREIVFEDEFDGEVLDSASYVPELGFNLRHAEAQYYLGGPENLTVGGGELVLTARAEAYEMAMFTSASIETRGLRSWTYGLFEARILAPTGQGCSPAFWLYPEAPGAPVKVCESFTSCVEEAIWPVWGDVVVMNVRSEQPAEVRHTASFATQSDMFPALTGSEGGGSTTLAAEASAEYHDYAVWWGPERIDWFVDGELQATFDTTAVEINHPEGKNPFAQPFHLKLSLALGGLAEAPVAADYPVEMRVDWLRVTQFK
jgi:beta-glucanase (GH16 family)